MANTLRRDFLLGSLAAGVAAEGLAAPKAGAADLPTRVLGKTGAQVTIIGLGGGRLPMLGEQEAIQVTRRALEMGITFFDNARGYGDGFSETVYGKALGSNRKSIFLTTKTVQRSRAGAEADLAASLKAYQTDYVDLWQIHSIAKLEDLEQIFAPGGAIEAFGAAKKAGKARFIGFTGHHDPEVHARMLERYDFDTILMPLHCADPHYLSFQKRVLGRAAEKGMGIQAMKTLANAKLLQSLTVDQCMNYALTLPIHTAVMGCTTVGQVDDTVRVAQAFQKLKPAEAEELAARVKPIMGPDLEDWKRRT